MLNLRTNGRWEGSQKHTGCPGLPRLLAPLPAVDLEQLLLKHNTEKGVTQHHRPHPVPHATPGSIMPLQPSKQLVSMDPRVSQPRGPQVGKE